MTLFSWTCSHTYMHILGVSVDPLNSYQLWVKNLWVDTRKLLKYYLLNKIIICQTNLRRSSSKTRDFSFLTSEKKVWNNPPQTYRICLWVLHGKRFNLFDIDVVVELDEVSPLFLLHVTVGPREASRGRRGAARLWDWQGAAGPHDRTGVSAGCTG